MLLISHNLGSLSLRWDYLHAFKFPWILLVLKKFGPGQKRGMKGRVRGEIGWWGCYSRNVLRLGRHLAADYTIIMSKTLTGNHTKFAHFVLLAISEEAKAWLPCLHRWPSRHRKSSWRQGLTNTKRSTNVAKQLFADYVKKKKLREPEEKKKLAQTSKTF